MIRSDRLNVVRGSLTLGSPVPDAEDSFYRNLLESLYEAVYFVDPQRRIGFWNRAAEKLTGFGREEMVGSFCHDNRLNHVDERGRQLCTDGCPLLATIQDGEPREARVFLRHKQGHRVPVRVRIAPIRDPSGRITGAVELFTDDSARQETELRLRELERLALIDHLTGMPNRRYLESTLHARHGETQRYGGSFGVLVADIDHFKNVNDALGHDAGDRVLVTVGRTLRAAVRPFDVIGRWGGEEFIGLLVNIGGDELAAVGDRLRALVERTTIPEQPGLTVTISVGGALATPGEGVSELLRRADEQLYRAKREGRNRVAIGS